MDWSFNNELHIHFFINLFSCVKAGHMLNQKPIYGCSDFK